MLGYLKYFFFKRERNKYLKQMSAADDPWSSALIYPVLASKIKDVLGEQRFENSLDIGCGKGLYTEFLKSFSQNHLGVDIVPPAGADYQALDFDRLPSLNKKFNLIVLNFVLDYLGFQDHPKIFTANLFSFVQSCVAPGATLLIFNPVYKTETWDRVQKYQFLLERFGFETLKRELISTPDLQVAFLLMKFRTR